MNKEFLARLCILFLASLCTEGACAQLFSGEWIIPTRGNSYVINKGSVPLDSLVVNRETVIPVVERGGFVLKNGFKRQASTYIYIPAACNPLLSINAVGVAALKITCCEQTFSVDIDASRNQKVEIGRLNIDKPQYIRLDFETKDIGRPTYVVVHDVILSEMKPKPLYITNNYNTFFGLRGASVYLNYHTDAVADPDWIYNEITIPKDCHTSDSYFCVQGFDGGFLGLRDRQNGERSMLFSIWASSNDNQTMNFFSVSQIAVLRKHPFVKVGNLNQKDCGMQCELNYPWKQGEKYKFLVHASRVDTMTTDYTAYFYAEDKKEWIELAKIRKMHSHQGLTGFYSFIETVNPQMGVFKKRAVYGNIWMRSGADKQWYPITQAKFSNDDTGLRGVRVDFEGKVEGKNFSLTTGGFFGNGADQERKLQIETPSEIIAKQQKNYLEHEINIIIQNNHNYDSN